MSFRKVRVRSKERKELLENEKLNLTSIYTLDSIPNEVNTILMLDFDGVFNSMYRNGVFKKEYYQPTHRENILNPLLLKGDLTPPKKYELQWSEELIKDFNKHFNNPSTLIIWVTTWREHMGKVVEMMGLKSHYAQYFLPWGDNYSYDHNEKVTAVKKWLNKTTIPNTKIVWIDDVLFRNNIINKGADLLGNKVWIAGESIHCNAPDSRYGISRSDFQELLKFLSKGSRSSNE